MTPPLKCKTCGHPLPTAANTEGHELYVRFEDLRRWAVRAHAYTSGATDRDGYPLISTAALAQLVQDLPTFIAPTATRAVAPHEITPHQLARKADQGIAVEPT